MKYENTKVDCNCPVCGNTTGLKLWETDSYDSAQHFLLKEADIKSYSDLVKHIEQLWNQNSNIIIRCQNCGLCYSSPFIGGDQKFYSLAYQRSNYPAWKWEYQITLEQLRRKNEGFRFLEIGAGNGTFIKSFIDKLTSKENIFCTEYSGYGLDMLQKLGVNYFNEDVRNLDSIGKFDVICMFQVLEHLNNLDKLFQTLDSLLNKGGSLFIAVPNDKFIEFIEHNGALLDMPPNHVTRWTKEAFGIIANKYNWEFADFRTEPTDWIANMKLFALYYFLKRSQKKGTLANIVCRMQVQDQLKKILKVGLIFLYSFILIKQFYNLKSKELGNSQWVHFSKI